MTVTAQALAYRPWLKRRVFKCFLHTDIDDADVTWLSGRTQNKATAIARQPGILCGWPVAWNSLPLIRSEPTLSTFKNMLKIRNLFSRFYLFRRVRAANIYGTLVYSDSSCHVTAPYKLSFYYYYYYYYYYYSLTKWTARNSRPPIY